MGFLDNFFNKSTSTPKSLDEQRKLLQDKMVTKLSEKGFTKMEAMEILDIITLAENDIQVIRSSLMGTKIDSENPTPLMKKVAKELTDRKNQMEEEIKVKIIQIKKRKELYKKEME